jgi:hypothetical protein
MNNEPRQTAPDPPADNTPEVPGQATAILQKTTPQKLTKTKRKRLNIKQSKTLEYWLSPKSITYGNLYRSALQAGFSKSYALNLTSLRPSWLSEAIDLAKLEASHIAQGVQALAVSAPNAKSPDDTRLKAYELLAKLSGLLDSNKGTTVNIVQPILGGASMREPEIK